MKVLKLLIDKGGDVNKARNNGRTPVYVAAAENNLTCLELLISKKADVNAPDKYGRTPLNSATNEKIKILLRKNGATWII